MNIGSSTILPKITSKSLLFRSLFPINTLPSSSTLLPIIYSSSIPCRTIANTINSYSTVSASTFTSNVSSSFLLKSKNTRIPLSNSDISSSFFSSSTFSHQQLRSMSSEARRFPVRVKRAVSIILLEQIDTLGYKGEEITVTPGYARNYLIPYRKAVYATQINRSTSKITLSPEEIKLKIEERARNRLISRIKDVVVRFQRATSDGVNLYSGVTAADIVEQLESTPIHNLRIKENNIKIGTGPAGSVRHGGGVLSTVGKHTIQVEPARYSPGLWAPMTIEIISG